MNLYLFNSEFEEGDWTDTPATYVIAKTVEEAIDTYKKGPNNNECIWSVKYLSSRLSGTGHRPILIQKEVVND